MHAPRSQHPPLALMHLSFLFTGAGTLLLGPTLPVFTQHWHLHDSQSGLLIAAQFLGLFTGAIALHRNLRLTLLCGDLLAALGFVLLTLSLHHPGGYPLGVASFYLLGTGLGQVTTTVNLLSALRYSTTQQRSSALSLLNFTWSAGAVLSPLFAGIFLAHAKLTSLLLGFASVAVLLCAVTLGSTPPVKRSNQPEPRAQPGIALSTLAFFCILYLLYGGLEATLGGWLSTYTLRYTPLGIAAAAFCTTAMWSAFAIGRFSAAGLLRYVPERFVRSSGVLLAAVATVALRGVHTGAGITTCAALIGLGIAPFFPVTFSLLLTLAPTPRQAGAATANIGLGSAIFPYLTGLLSTRLDSLHTAMLAPIAIAVTLLILCSLNLRPTSTSPV